MSQWRGCRIKSEFRKDNCSCIEFSKKQKIHQWTTESSSGWACGYELGVGCIPRGSSAFSVWPWSITSHSCVGRKRHMYNLSLVDCFVAGSVGAWKHKTEAERGAECVQTLIALGWTLGGLLSFICKCTEQQHGQTWCFWQDRSPYYRWLLPTLWHRAAQPWAETPGQHWSH